MNKKQYHEYLKSAEWQNVRTAVLQRDGYRCRFCNSGLDLNVHHRSYEYIGREMQNLTDLVTICRRCHAMLHVVEPKLPEPKPKKKRKAKKRKEPKKHAPRWDEGFLELRKSQHESNKQERRAVIMGQANGKVELDKEAVRLMETFGCAMPIRSVQKLGMERLVSGWRKELLGKVYTVGVIVAVYSAANENEAKLIEQQGERINHL